MNNSSILSKPNFDISKKFIQNNRKMKIRTCWEIIQDACENHIDPNLHCNKSKFEDNAISEFDNSYKTVQIFYPKNNKKQTKSCERLGSSKMKVALEHPKNVLSNITFKVNSFVKERKQRFNSKS